MTGCRLGKHVGVSGPDTKLGMSHLEHGSVEVHPTFIWNQVVLRNHAVKHVHEQGLPAAYTAVQVQTCSKSMVVHCLTLARPFSLTFVQHWSLCSTVVCAAL